MSKEKENLPFIDYLYSLAKENNRGALADLRKGMNGQPGSVPATFTYVAPWVPDEHRNKWQEKVYYIIAAMFAYYQSSSGGKTLSIAFGNMGDHCRALKAKKKQSASFENRFTNLLKAHRDDLPVLLRQVLSLLRGEEIPINWNQLFYDLTYWNSEKQTAQRNWANSYWRYVAQTEQTEENDQN